MIFVHIFDVFSIVVLNFHVCCIRFDHFNFNNNLYIYTSFNQKYRLKRQSLKKIIIYFKTKLKRKKINVTNVFDKKFAIDEFNFYFINEFADQN